MTYETFIESARMVTAPGYEPLPWDEDVLMFLEMGNGLAEAQDHMTTEEFDDFCRANAWVGGSAGEVCHFLDALRNREESDSA